MTSTVICPTCGARLSVLEHAAGRRVRCPRCAAVTGASNGVGSPPHVPPVAPSATPMREEIDFPNHDEEPAPLSRSRRSARRREDYESENDNRESRHSRRDDVEAAPLRKKLPKSRLAYILLALFFGGLGVHNFYVSRTTQGVCQLIIWTLSFPLMCVGVGFFTIFIPIVWSFIEVIIVNQDGDGVSFS